MKSTILSALLTAAFFAATITNQPASAANANKCEDLYLALNDYENAKEAWLNASSDESSIGREKDASPLLKKLASQRADIKELHLAMALKDLRHSLSSMEATKDWDIPEFKGLANYRHMQFYIIAADVVCP